MALPKDTRIIKATYLYILDKLSINPVLHTRKCNRDVLHCLHVDVPVPKPYDLSEDEAEEKSVKYTM